MESESERLRAEANAYIDTVSMARRKFPGNAHSLAALHLRQHEVGREGGWVLLHRPERGVRDELDLFGLLD